MMLSIRTLALLAAIFSLLLSSAVISDESHQLRRHLKRHFKHPESPKPPKPPFHNVIILIPDGCDEAVQTLTRWYKGDSLTLDGLPRTSVKNHAANSVITDSAAAATAFASGYKTTANFLGVGPRIDNLLSIYKNAIDMMAPPYAPVTSVLEAAQYVNKSVGLVATSSLSHATPAAFACHIQHRNKDHEIMEHLVYNNLDVAFGGGKSSLLPRQSCSNHVPGGTRTDCQNLWDVLAERGVQFVETRDELQQLTSGRAWGIFARIHMQPDIDRKHFAPEEPSLQEMIAKAIDLLSQNEQGFLLVVEGSQIDWGGHFNDPIHMTTDFLAFDNAAQVAVDFAANNGETLVLVYADHITGGMTIGNFAHGYAGVSIEALVGPLHGMNVTADGLVKLMPRNPTIDDVRAAVQNYWNLEISPADVEAIFEYGATTRRSLSYSLPHVLSERYTYIGWTSHGHNGETTPLWVYGASAPDHVIENTDLAWMVAAAMGVDLQGISHQLFVDLDTTTLEYQVNLNNSRDPVVEFDGAILPIGKDYIVLDSEIVMLPGLTVYAPMTGKVYISQTAIGILQEFNSDDAGT
jgi:alkaline phosphatase